MKHLKRFNEQDSWIGDMLQKSDWYQQHKSNQEKDDKVTDQNTPQPTNVGDIYKEFRVAVINASKGDVYAHQKMIDLLDEHGVDLIKWRRYLHLKRAAELGKEEVMDVLFDALEKAGEDTTELKKGLEEYVRAGRG